MLILKLNQLLKTSGIDIKQILLSLRGITNYFNNYSKIKAEINNTKTDFPIKNLNPCLADRYDKAGSLPLHYFYQDIHIAQKIFENNPVKHVDIGSRIDGFVAHVASFREIEIFDIRSMNIGVNNIKFVKADLSELNFVLENYCDSISCLHVIEHFGLGRYGDTIDINGHIKGLNNIYKILKPGGKFYFSTPIGEQRIEFDAHRVFSVQYLLDLFYGKYSVESFSYVDDQNVFHSDCQLNALNIEKNFNCNYGCGIFELTKL